MVNDNSPSLDGDRGVSLAPSSMIDPVADWNLNRVIDHLRQQELAEGGHAPESDCRCFSRSGIRLFTSVVDELAEHYDVSRGKMCRWLSYHGASIASSDPAVSVLSQSYSQLRKVALTTNSRAVADILATPAPYAPYDEESRRISLYAYSSWVVAAFADLAQVCGVPSASILQVYMVRSILTSDLVVLTNVVGRLHTEVDWWSRWMKFRAGVLEIAVAVWGAEG